MTPEIKAAIEKEAENKHPFTRPACGEHHLVHKARTEVDRDIFTDGAEYGYKLGVLSERVRILENCHRDIIDDGAKTLAKDELDRHKKELQELLK